MTASVDRNPSVDQLLALQRIWSGLWNAFAHEHNATHRQEADILEYFGPLSDVVRSIRPCIESFEGWNVGVSICVRTLIKGFDEYKGAWGWADLDVPEPERSRVVARRRAAFEDEFERPLIEAAVSWREGWENPGDIIRYVEEWADKAEGPIKATVTPEEGRARWEEAYGRWLTAASLGKRYPSDEAIGQSHLSGLRLMIAQAIGELGNRLEKVVSEDPRSWHPDPARSTQEEPGPAESPQAAATPPSISRPEPERGSNPIPGAERRRGAEKPKPIRAEDRRLAVVTTIEALMRSECWGVMREEIANKMKIPYKTFCRYLKHETVAATWELYERNSMGRQPGRLDDLGEGTWFSLRDVD